LGKTLNVRIVQDDGFWTKLVFGLVILAVLIKLAIYVGLAALVLWLVFTHTGRSVIKFAGLVVITPFLLVFAGLLWLAKRVSPKDAGATKQLSRTPPPSDDSPGQTPT
jgi:hypothetical protein